MKSSLKKEGSELPTKCSQLKLFSADGKRYKTDVADTEQLLCIIQSIRSSKAESFKLWLAQLERERVEETKDPELIIERVHISEKAIPVSGYISGCRLFRYAKS